MSMLHRILLLAIGFALICGLFFLCDYEQKLPPVFWGPLVGVPYDGNGAYTLSFVLYLLVMLPVLSRKRWVRVISILSLAAWFFIGHVLHTVGI